MSLTAWGGVPFKFNAATTLLIPPIALGDFEQLQERLKGVPDVTTVIDATFAALKRNYPEMTRDQVAQLIDMGNKNAVFQAVMGVSVPKTPPGEEPEPGEAAAP